MQLNPFALVVIAPFWLGLCVVFWRYPKHVRETEKYRAKQQELHMVFDRELKRRSYSKWESHTWHLNYKPRKGGGSIST